MTSSHKKNNTKQTSRVGSSSSNNNITKSNSNKNRLCSSWKKSKKFELSKRRLIPLIIDKQTQLIIEWKEEEKEIYITGNFYKNNKFNLAKTNQKIYNYFRFNSNIFNSLKRKKFKVEGKMKINSIYIINNSNSKTNKKKENYGNIFSNSSTKESSLISIPKYKIKTKKIIDFNFSKKNFCNYIPKQDEMRYTAEKKPCHFPIECFQGINQIHNEIGNKEYLTLTNKNVFNSNNDSYKIIDRKEHFLLNHLCQKKFYENLVNSFTVKYRHKNVTFVYYK